MGGWVGGWVGAELRVESACIHPKSVLKKGTPQGSKYATSISCGRNKHLFDSF